jgi:hypothetical protein
MNELFMPETAEDAEKLGSIVKIHVRRMEGGKFVYAPTSFEPAALTSIEQVHELYGGGDYMIEGRDNGGIFVKNHRVQLPGKPKPLSLEQQEQEAAAAAAKLAPTPAPAAPPASEGSMLMQLMMAQMQQTTQILTAVLSRGDSSSNNLLERSRQLEDRARTEHTEFMRTLLERANTAAAGAAGGGAGTKESFIEGMEFAQGLVSEMMAKQESGENPADLLSSLSEFMKGLGQVGKEVASTGGNGIPSAGHQ